MPTAQEGFKRAAGRLKGRPGSGEICLYRTQNNAR